MSLPNEDNIYRLVHVTIRDSKNKAIPAPRCFAPSNTDEGNLSVDWEHYTTPEKSLARWGASYKWGTEVFKDHKQYS